ncbi:MAG: hypothetical protein J0M07_19790 [Anaerolineae bacterium]|nr:hypothetical protein [Anaerolineae bacterium]
MRDLDIIERVCDIFETKYANYSPKKLNWSVTYKAVIRGSRAVELMRTLRPFMGQRRQKQIDRALDGYVDKSPEMLLVTKAKLNEQQVYEIKQRIALKHTSKEIAADYGVTIFTIREIRQGKIWKHVTLEAPMQPFVPMVTMVEPDFKSLDWLAGLLEGEGSFCPPAPTTPNTPYISLAMTDEDIVARACEFFAVKPKFIERKNPAHKNYFLGVLRGERAVELMNTLKPKLGQRRQAQIERALQNYHLHDASNHRPGAKVTAEQVREIRRRLEAGHSMLQLAEEFGLSYASLVDINLRRTWRNI